MKALKIIGTVALAVIISVTLFFAGYFCGEIEEEKNSRVEEIARTGIRYYRLVRDVPYERLCDQDREILMDILDGRDIRWYDNDYHVSYVVWYEDSNGGHWSGLGNGTIDGFIEDLINADEVRLVTVT